MGEQIEVAISIDVTQVDAPDQALGSFSGSLDWDPAVLAYAGDSGILAGFSGVVNDARASSGHLIFNGAKAAGATGNFTVLSITFDVIGSGSSKLGLNYSAMSAAYSFSNLLPLLTVYDGRVEVGPAQYYSLTIAVDPAEGGTTDPEVGAHTYPEGTALDLTAMPNAKFAFEHWSGACTGSGPCQVTMNADKAVTAVFAELPLTCYSLTLSHAGQGSDPLADPTRSAGCPSGQYIEGETINLSGAIPDPGWQISGWTGTSPDNSTADTNSLTMPASARAVGVTYQVYTNVPTNLPGAATSEPDLSQTTIEESGAVATSCSNPDSGVLDSNSPKISAQQVARAQDLIIDPEYSDVNDLTYVIRDRLTYGVLRVIGQLSCMLALLFGLVLSALLVIRYRFVSSE